MPIARTLILTDRYPPKTILVLFQVSAKRSVGPLSESRFCRLCGDQNNLLLLRNRERNFRSMAVASGSLKERV